MRKSFETFWTFKCASLRILSCDQKQNRSDDDRRNKTFGDKEDVRRVPVETVKYVKSLLQTERVGQQQEPEYGDGRETFIHILPLYFNTHYLNCLEFALNFV